MGQFPHLRTIYIQLMDVLPQSIIHDMFQIPVKVDRGHSAEERITARQEIEIKLHIDSPEYWFTPIKKFVEDSSDFYQTSSSSALNTNKITRFFTRILQSSTGKFKEPTKTSAVSLSITSIKMCKMPSCQQQTWFENNIKHVEVASFVNKSGGRSK